MQHQPSDSDLQRVEPTKARIQIFTFGTLQVIRDETAVTESDWHTRQARQLLKILITERPRPVSTDLLIEILWPNSTPHAAATTLRSAINALRNVLEPDRPNRAPSRYIVTQAPGYAFHLAPEIWLDVEEFDHLYNRAHNTADSGLRLHLLEQAIDLYADDYLISDPYADWLQAERERLRERFFNALLMVADIYAETGHYADAITACRRMLARDEVRENAYQSLMRFQAESGDSAGALLTYERCRTILSEELGADPSPLTQTLHQRILNGDVEPRPVIHTPLTPIAAPAMLPPSAPVAPQPVELPPLTLLTILDAGFPEVFVGRTQEMAALQERLQHALHGRGEWLLMQGEAGVGKTRLAYQLLRQAVKEAATVISATCQALERDLPFAPLADALGRYFYNLPEVVVQSLPAGTLGALAQIIPSLQDRLLNTSPTPSESAGNAEENRQRLIDSIVTTLVMLAKLRPLVFFVDDLQWADPDTLTVLNRLVQRLPELPALLLMAYRAEDLPENSALVTFTHTLNRLQRDAQLSVPRFARRHVQELVERHLAAPHTSEHTLTPDAAYRLGDMLYETTQGNALFVTEALHNLDERLAASDSDALSAIFDAPAHDSLQPAPTIRSQRIQEIILERLDRLPTEARAVLNLCAVIGRDFSLDLLESAATLDPLGGLEALLNRKFLIERPDERIDFAHHLVRQTVYDSLSLLQRRRLHLAVAEALVDLGQGATNPGEISFHYAQAGGGHRLLAAQYGVQAGEKLLQSYGFRQAVDAFDRALAMLDVLPDASPDLTRRSLQGRGLAYESLFDPEGVASAYRRLQSWARTHGDRALILATYSRLTTALGLLGQQAESNEVLDEFLRAIRLADGEAPASHVLVDLLERRRRIYHADQEEDDGQWTRYQPAPPPVADPEADILHILEPVHAVVPLFEYGWVLLVQGQLGEATRILEAVVDLATETNQPSIASAAYHQLAMTARVLGDVEQSQALNDESIAINRAVAGATGELGSLLPRISSGFLSLQAGRLDEAERRFRRVADILGDRAFFRNYRNSAEIGLGLVALARGDVAQARRRLEAAQADSVNIYPYTYVQALLGLARIADSAQSVDDRDQLLRKALRFAGQRSLLEEYMSVLVALARMDVTTAPLDNLVDSLLEYVTAIHLEAGVATLRALHHAHAAT
jgi:DNA-binding SARP family transcriptional activator/DNA polymerase III delta prime subunit